MLMGIMFPPAQDRSSIMDLMTVLFGYCVFKSVFKDTQNCDFEDDYDFDDCEEFDEED